MAALKTNETLREEAGSEYPEYLETAEFLTLVLDWYNIINNTTVGGIGSERCEITSVDDEKLSRLLTYAGVFWEMQNGRGPKRKYALC